jgi:hypothetical protein
VAIVSETSGRLRAVIRRLRHAERHGAWGSGMSDTLSAPDTKAGRLQRACLNVLRQHERDGALPTNGRFVFYELEQTGVIPKAYLDEHGRKRARQPAQDISDALMTLRRLGLVPWNWLTDETREVTEWRYATTVYSYVLANVEDARIDCWAGDPPPLIVCESRATKGVLERITARYLCPITATNGQSGGFIVTDIVPLLSDNGRPVLYIGDCEVSGPADQIEANTQRYIEEHSGRIFTARTWSRVALTREQVNRSPRLRKLVIDKIDRRYKTPRAYQAIECEAVGQVLLEQMLRARLEGLLPKPLADVLERQARQRAKIRRAFARIARSER